MEHSSPETRIAFFHGDEIRRLIHDNEWWFSVVDIVAALTGSVNPRDYWFKMKIRVQSDDGVELSTLCRQLKLKSSDGKSYETDCANTEGIFRIIQSIPSPKAEPFKRWLARVGYERVQDTPIFLKRHYDGCRIFAVLPSRKRSPRAARAPGIFAFA